MGKRNLSASPRRRRSSAAAVKQPRLEDTFRNAIDQRKGTVLARGTIVKAEHFSESRHIGVKEVAGDMLLLMGAPNWRTSLLRISGTAQPTVVGLATVLKSIGCGPGGDQACTWFSAREEPVVYLNERPFVLRDLSNPLANIKTYTGISGGRLELMEDRLKQDILAEASERSGLFLVHNELQDGRIMPCLVSADSVRTSREVFDGFSREAGYRLAYHRVPVTRMQTPTDAYIGDYLEAFRRIPVGDAVIFSCGMGVGRTTFGMVIGLLIRRSQLMASGEADPFEALTRPADDLDQPSRTVLRLVYALEQGLQSKVSEDSAIEWTISRSTLVESLKQAIQGNYHVISELIRVMPRGAECKRVVDMAIDLADDLINIREHILINRVRHLVTGEADSLEMALGLLERYFCLIALTAFIEESLRSANAATTSFKAWIQSRSEVWYLFTSLRARRGQYKPFRPVDDLSNLATRSNNLELFSCGNAEAPPADPHLVIKNRSGSVLTGHTIIKLDHWASQFVLPTVIAGAPNFRKIDGFPIYAVAQPAAASLQTIVDAVRQEACTAEMSVAWFNVREEPLVYINDEPYVLRDQYATLRNIKAYSGISSDRLEMMESRLKEDVLNELDAFDHQILLHAETDGKLQVRWERADQVLTPRELFGQLKAAVRYYRLPVTAEDSWEPQDFDRLLQIASTHNLCYIL